MKNLDQSAVAHPHPVERNRAILEARDLIEINDWVIMSCKRSRLSGGRHVPGDAVELFSLAVLAPDGRILMDLLVRPDGALNSDLLKLHGCDSARTFNAPYFSSVHQILTKGFAQARVLCFQPLLLNETLNELCSQEKLPMLAPRLIDLQELLSRFTGSVDQSGSAYQMQSLPEQADCGKPAVPALAQCRYLLSLVKEIASSSQILDSAATFDKNWSAAFYKPRLGAAEKIKEMLGILD